MSVGNQPTVVQINATLTSLSLQLRALMRQITEQQQYVVNLGLTGLENIGGDGNGFAASDAQTVLNDFSYMNAVAGVYFGTVQQGGSGGTGATLFNFDNQLSALWAGQ